MNLIQMALRFLASLNKKRENVELVSLLCDGDARMRMRKIKFKEAENVGWWR